MTRGQVHSTLSSGGINLAWNKACGPHWPSQARAFDKKIFGAVGKDSDTLTLEEVRHSHTHGRTLSTVQCHLSCAAPDNAAVQDDVPINFPTDTIIHRAAMAVVEKGRGGVHEDIITGLLETWVPWTRQEVELVRSNVLMQQVVAAHSS